LAIAESVAQRGENRARVEPIGFLYGAAIGIQREIYVDYDQRVIPLPILGYRGEKLNVFGPFVSYEILSPGDFSFSARAQPRFAGFDESDSDFFEGMEERKISMDVGLGLNYEQDNWKFELAGLHDALDRSNGMELSASLGKVIRFGSVFVEPEAGLSFLDSRHVDYYYGVDQAEATNFRPEYEGDNALNSSLGVSLTPPCIFRRTNKYQSQEYLVRFGDYRQPAGRFGFEPEPAHFVREIFLATDVPRAESTTGYQAASLLFLNQSSQIPLNNQL
jgi:outer membrane protein